MRVPRQKECEGLWTRSRGKGGVVGGIGIDTHILLILYIKQIAKGNLLCSTGNSSQWSVVA